MHCQRCGGITESRERDGHMRPVCTSCGAVTYLDPKLAVVVVIARNERILLGKRGPGTRNPGTWSFPAGFVERGEVVEAAAIREVREETGLEITLGPVLGVLSEPGETVVALPFPAITISGEAIAGDDLDDVAWFPVDALPELAFDHDRHIVRLWQDWHATIGSAAATD